MIGEHSVTVTPVAGGAAVDISCLVDAVSIHHGRDDANGQPDASSCTLDMSWDTSGGPALPTSVEVGSVLTVTTTVGGIGYVRFRGRVTDMSVGWDAAGEDTPDKPLGQVIATGPQADLGRRIVGAEPFPQQLDGARVAAVFTAAGLALDPAFSDPGTVQILPRDIDSTDALGVITETAESAGGMLWATRDGLLRYADADHRRNQIAALTLDACDVLVTPTWQRNTAGLVNKVSIGYGVAPEGGEGGEQPRYVAEHAASVATYGRYEFTTATLLAAVADAQAMGQLLLARNRAPVWNMAALPVDVRGLDADQTAALLGLDVHALVTLTGLPAVGTVPTSVHLWIEGWDETLTDDGHELTLAITNYCRTSPPPRWNDLAPSITWDTAPGTWDDAACLGPRPSLGRWDDVSASLRWDQIAAAVTWDTWEG